MNCVFRSENGIKVASSHGAVKELKMGLVEYLNNCAMSNLSTYEGRTRSVKSIIGITSKIPLFIDYETLMFPTKGVRNYDCVFINYYQILSIAASNNYKTVVRFKDLTNVVLDIDFSKVNLQIKRCKKIIEYLSIKRKCLH